MSPDIPAALPRPAQPMAAVTRRLQIVRNKLENAFDVK